VHRPGSAGCDESESSWRVSAFYRNVFYGAQQMLFDKFDYSGGRIFDGHLQLLGDVNIDSFSGCIKI
jgi:hypothetical protein